MWTKFTYPHVSQFVMSFVMADLIIAACVLLARRLRMVDRPHSYKSHSMPTPFLGGVGIYLAFAVTIFSILRLPYEDISRWFEILSIVSAGGVVLVLGLADDFISINATVKLAILFIVTWILHSYNVTLTMFPHDLLWNAPNFLLTMFWIAGVISALNSLDNMDGAAGGIAAIASAAFFIIGWYTYQRWMSFVAVSLCGACLGFLRHNFHFEGARVFMGDNGAFFLGLALAAIGVLGNWSGIELTNLTISVDPLKSLIVPCAVLGVPLFDITLSTILRVMHGKVKSVREAIEFCGRDHIAHRLVALGYSRRQAVLCLYFIAILFGSAGAAIVLLNMDRSQYLGLSALGIAALTALGIYLNTARVYEDEQTYIRRSRDAVAPRPANTP